MSALIEIVTTVSNEAEATELAREAIASGLAACANAFPVRSIYRWQGELCEETEVQLVLKTLPETAAALEALVAERHSYDTPALYRVSLENVREDYAEWVRQSVRKSEDPRL